VNKDFQIKFNFNNFARVCHSWAACQPAAYAVVAGGCDWLSNNDVISLRSLRRVRCVGWKSPFTVMAYLVAAAADVAALYPAMHPGRVFYAPTLHDASRRCEQRTPSTFCQPPVT